MAKVLVTRLSSLGDVAMLVPVITSVAAAYPQDRFTVLTRVAFAPLFQNLGFNINVIPVDLKKRHKGVTGFFRILQKTVSVSHVVDEHDVIRTKMLRWALMLLGKKVVHIDKGRQDKLLAIKTKHLDPPLKTSIERYMDTFTKTGFGTKITFTNFFTFTPREFSDLSPAIVPEKKGEWIGIAPFAKHEGKIYPIEKMEKVVASLSQHPGTTIFLFGGGHAEKEILDGWASKYPHVINMAGKLNLAKELLLISYLDVMLSMDSANMHLASLVEVPVISIWGATHPAIGFYGFNQDPANAIQIDLYCRPCSVYGDSPCTNAEIYACMNNIKESVIVDKINEVLAKRKK